MNGLVSYAYKITVIIYIYLYIQYIVYAYVCIDSSLILVGSGCLFLRNFI